MLVAACVTTEGRARWPRITRRALIILAGLAGVAVIAVLLGLVLWLRLTTGQERITSDLREAHNDLRVPENWRYVGEEEHGTPECYWGSCLQVIREYMSDLPPEHPDACPWAREAAEQWGTVTASSNGTDCRVAAKKGSHRMVVSVSVDAEPTVEVIPRSDRPPSGNNRLTIWFECCR